MQLLQKPLLRSVLLFSFTLIISLHAETIEVAGYTFSSPAKVTGEEGKDAEVAFFYFGSGGAGGVKANVDRWMTQFEEAKGRTIKNTTIGDIPVTYAQAHGTFLSGRAFGPKTPKANYAILGAIIEGENGSIFIKMTGPTETVESQVSIMKKMVLDCLDK